MINQQPELKGWRQRLFLEDKLMYHPCLAIAGANKSSLRHRFFFVVVVVVVVDFLVSGEALDFFGSSLALDFLGS
jgi:hypothetical protein